MAVPESGVTRKGSREEEGRDILDSSLSCLLISQQCSPHPNMLWVTCYQDLGSKQSLQLVTTMWGMRGTL